MQRAMRWFAAVVGLAAGALGQARAAIGTFVDPDGAPVAGATVTLATGDPMVFDAFEPPETITATTDERGRVRVLLRTGHAYSAWACEGHDVARPSRSAIVEGVVAGELFELRVQERRRLHRVTVDGFVELGEGPFELRLRCDARHGIEWRVPIDEDGRAELPPLPAGPYVWHIVGANGRDVVRSGSWLGRKLYPFPAKVVRARVVDEQGQPVAGIPVHRWSIDFVGHTQEPFSGLRLLPARVPCGVTDADGRVQFELRDQLGFLYAFDDARSALVGGEANGGPMVDGVFTEPDWQESPEQTAARVYTLTLRKRPVLRGRLHRGGAPLAGIGLLVNGDIKVVGKGNMQGVTVRRNFEVRARTAPDGTFEVPALPLPVGSFRVNVEGKARQDRAPIVLRERQQVGERPLDLDLAKWPVVTFQVLDASKGPPAEARVALWSSPESPPVVLVPDRAGRARAQLELGSWCVLATGDQGARFDVLELQPGPRARSLELALEPLATCSGVLRDAAGKPIAGRKFFLSSYRSDRLSPDTPLRQRRLAQYAMPINRGLTSRTTTAKDGTFTLRFLHIPGTRCSGGFGSTGLHLEPGKTYDLQAR